MHGYELRKRLNLLLGGGRVLSYGSLYPALQRMLVQGWISGTWGRTADNRRARYYRVTRAGHRHLERSLQSYARVLRAIAAILDLSPAGA